MMVKKIKSFLLENKNARQTVAKNTFWLFFGQIFSKLIKVVIIIYAARVIGATEYGAFSYALSLAGFFTVFTDFGINATITREASKDISAQEKYFSTAIVIKTIVIAFIAFFVVVLSPVLFKEKEVAALMPIVIFIVGFDSLRDFGASLYRAWEKMEMEALVQIITNVFIVIGGFLALYYSHTAKALSLGYVIGTGIGMIVAFVPFKKYLRSIKETFSKSLIKSLLYSSWPIGFVGIMGGVMLNTDNLMIAWLRNITEVGYYSASQRIAQVIFILPGLISAAFFPTTAKLYDQKERVAKIVEKSSALLFMVALPLTVGGVLLAYKIVHLLFGTEYMAGAPSFQILSLMYIPSFLVAAFGNPIFIFNKERKLFAYAIIGVLGNFIFDLIFIPIWGIAGSAISSLLNQTISTSYLYFILKKELRFSFPKIKNFIWSAIIMALAIIFLEVLNINLYAIIILATISYFGSLYLFKESLLFEIKEIFIQKTKA